MKIKFVNAKILTDSGSKIFNGVLTVENEEITYVGIDDIAGNFDRVVDCKENLIMAGFVNCHAHSPMVLFRGMGDGADLQDWLNNYIFKMESKLKKADVYYSTLMAICEYLKSGITTVNDDYFYYDELARAYDDAQFRGVVAISPNYSNKTKLNFEKLEEKTAELEQKFKNSLVKFNFYCHSVYQNDERDFANIVKLAKKYNTFVSTHMSETLEEVGVVANNNNDITPTKLLESYGFFDRPSLVAHSVYVNNDDIAILKKNNASVVINSSSNLKLASGIPPVYSLTKFNVNVCLGTDGASSNNRLDMFREMFLASAVQRGYLKSPKIMQSEIVLKMATENGAKALGLNDVGILKKGYKADIIMLDCSTCVSDETIKNDIVYAFGVENVLMTMVNGKILYENGKYNLKAKYKKILNNFKKIVERIKKWL